MEEKDYKIIAFDAQYFLYRNFAALKSRTGVDWVAYLEDGEGDTSEGHMITRYEFDQHDLVKQFFWTIAKVVREVASCEKIVLLWDYPPYHKTQMLPDYKGTRVRHCQEVLDEWDIDEDPVGYLQEKEEYRLELIKSQAKWWIITELDKLGMPSCYFSGYEADDLAIMFTRTVENEEGRYAICSADTDWMYWIGENVDWISFNKSEIWNLYDMHLEVGGACERLGATLFEIKAFMDSTFMSHNDLKPTTNLGRADLDQLWNEVHSGDYTNINDVDRLNLNLKTFNISEYPQYTDVMEKLKTIIFEGGSLGNMEYYQILKNKGFQVSYKYTDNYLSMLTNNYYHGK